MALAVLSGGPPRELLSAVAASDTARLTSVPGIGKRTAERIIVELKTKIPDVQDDPITVTKLANDPRALARDGLLGLGFAAPEIDKLLEGASGETPEALITHALKVSRR
jgi:Holliday junction DNA helicase RuvA